MKYDKNATNIYKSYSYLIVRPYMLPWKVSFK